MPEYEGTRFIFLLKVTSIHKFSNMQSSLSINIIYSKNTYNNCTHETYHQRISAISLAFIQEHFLEPVEDDFLISGDVLLEVVDADFLSVCRDEAGVDEQSGDGVVRLSI
jgi:hypothetical protein